MTARELYTIWAPSTAQHWSQFAKPAMFVHNTEHSFTRHRLEIPAIPFDMYQYITGSTTFIVDLPAATGVEVGLALANNGCRPVPLYNGVHAESIGGSGAVVDNLPIIHALKDGASILGSTYLPEHAPPAFLLDSRRYSQAANTISMFDNRWSLDFEDLPAAAFMQNAGISQVIVWTIGQENVDLTAILDSYADMGITIVMYCNNTGTYQLRPNRSFGGPSVAEHSPVMGPSHGLTTPVTLVQENVRKFENARFALMLIAGMAFVNFLFMFFFRGQPILWTAPTIMWLTYLWVPEAVGDVFAVIMLVMYFVLYIGSHRNRGLIKMATFLFGLEVVILGVYVLYYGFWAYIGGSTFMGLIVFGFPALSFMALFRGMMAQASMEHMSLDEYYTQLDTLDNGGVAPVHGHYFRRRRHFRGFRGYGGYGGGGRGGYSGGGYRGYGGGYGGGFGG